MWCKTDRGSRVSCALCVKQIKEVKIVSQKKGGVILAYISQIVAIMTGIIYTPFMLRALGQSEYGLYSLVSSTVSVLSMLNMGFSGCYLYFYNKLSTEKDKDSVAKFNAEYFLIFCFIAVLTLICGIFVYFNLDLFFGNGLSKAEYDKAATLTIVMVLNMAASLPINIFSSGINASGKFILENGYAVFNSLVTLVLNVFVLSRGYGSIGLTVVALFMTGVKFFLFFYIGIKVIKMNFCFKNLPISLVKSMLSFTIFIFFNQITNYLNSQLDKVLLGRFVGTSAVAVYSIGSTIYIYFQQFSNSITGVFGPQINYINAKYIAENNEKYGNKILLDVFIKVSRLQFYIAFLIITGFILFGKEFILLWAGSNYKSAYYIAIGLMLTSFVFQATGDTIQRAKFKHKIRAIVFLFMAILNVAISIPLIAAYGELGAAVGTMIVCVLGNGVFLNWYYYKKLHLDMKRYWRSIISLCKAVVFALFLGCVMVEFMVIKNWMELFMGAAIYSAVYIIICWILAFNQEEKNIAYSFLRFIMRHSE